MLRKSLIENRIMCHDMDQAYGQVFSSYNYDTNSVSQFLLFFVFFVI
jgi:hypothetical protein